MGGISDLEALLFALKPGPALWCHLVGQGRPLALNKFETGPILAPVFEATQGLELGAKFLALGVNPGRTGLFFRQFLEAGVNQPVDPLVLLANMPGDLFQGRTLAQSFGGGHPHLGRRISQDAGGEEVLGREAGEGGDPHLGLPGLGGDRRQDALLLGMGLVEFGDDRQAVVQVKGRRRLFAAEQMAITGLGEFPDASILVFLGQPPQFRQVGRSMAGVQTGISRATSPEAGFGHGGGF